MEKKQERRNQTQEKQTAKKDAREEENEILVRISGYDIPGSKNVYAGLTKIKGVSWSISNALCVKLNVNRAKKIAELKKEEIMEIESFLRSLPILNFLKNRRSDSETGETKHYLGSDLEIRREFDIKRLKEIKSYKGIRHSAKLPVRGQRTRSHFRKKGKPMGVKRKK
ncbi:MAG: 30S ribosomal protein S13 [Nanoarchaeota archaeon]